MHSPFCWLQVRRLWGQDAGIFKFDFSNFQRWNYRTKDAYKKDDFLNGTSHLEKYSETHGKNCNTSEDEIKINVASWPDLPEPSPSGNCWTSGKQCDQRLECRLRHKQNHPWFWSINTDWIPSLLMTLRKKLLLLLCIWPHNLHWQIVLKRKQKQCKVHIFKLGFLSLDTVDIHEIHETLRMQF